MAFCCASLFARAQASRAGDEVPPPPPPPEFIEEVQEEAPVFMVVEDMPEFPGGEQKMMEYIAMNLVYPEKARDNGIQGRVLIQFVVDESGHIINAKVMKGVHPELDSAALAVVKGMPKWKPGKQRGDAVRVRYIIPIRFVLDEEKPKRK